MLASNTLDRFDESVPCQRESGRDVGHLPLDVGVARKLMPNNGTEYTDQEVQKILDSLYAIADLAYQVKDPNLSM